MQEEMKERINKKALRLLDEHEAELKAELGDTALDLLSPKQSATELRLDVTRITDLTRQGWLAPAPVEPIGPAKLYYRWRVEFVKRYKRSNSRRQK